MIGTKRSIILSEGATVSITSPAGLSINTTALIGRANKQFNNTVSLETHRRCQLLPEIAVDSGYIVGNPITGEDYLVVATYPEIIQNAKAAEICHMFVCNCLFNLVGMVETADDRGRTTTQPVNKLTNQQAYIQSLTADLKQYETGLHPDAEYRIFAPFNDASPLDKISVLSSSLSIPVKIVHIDYLTYSGIAVLQVCSETRA